MCFSAAPNLPTGLDDKTMNDPIHTDQISFMDDEENSDIHNPPLLTAQQSTLAHLPVITTKQPKRLHLAASIARLHHKRSLKNVSDTTTSTTSSATSTTSKNSNTSQNSRKSLLRSRSAQIILNVESEDIAILNKELHACNRCFQCSRIMFSAADSFPSGSFFSLIIACIGVGMQFQGWSVADDVIYKYNPEMWYIIWLNGTIATVILIFVNVSVLGHGISLFLLSRSGGTLQCFGCCPTKVTRHATCGDRCVNKCGSCVGVTAQILNAVVGTIGIWFVYILALGVTFVCSLVVGISWLLERSCLTFQTIIEKYVDLANKYLAKAKDIITNNADKARDLLKEFQTIKDLTSMFTESALGEIVTGLASTGATAVLTGKIESASSVTSNIGDGGGVGSNSDTVYNGGAAAADAGADAANNYDGNSGYGGYGGRMLFVSDIDPEAMIAQGIDTLDILNQTIVDVEKQILYYKGVGNVMTEFCFDAASLYESVIILSIGAFIVSISQMLMFAFHVKQFTAWSYEVDLIRMLEDNQDMNNDEFDSLGRSIQRDEKRSDRKDVLVSDIGFYNLQHEKDQEKEKEKEEKEKKDKKEKKEENEEERKEKARKDWINERKKTNGGIELTVRRADTFVQKKKKKKNKKVDTDTHVAAIPSPSETKKEEQMLKEETKI